MYCQRSCQLFLLMKGKLINQAMIRTTTATATATIKTARLSTSQQGFQQAKMREEIPLTTKKLPKLPLPALNDTLTKFLRTVKPLVPEHNFQKTTATVTNFGTDGIGPKLQALLENRQNHMDNWMSEWWLNTAYLEYRQPVVIFSSPGLVFPLQEFKGIDDQLSYAAKMIFGAVSYKNLIDGGQIKQDMIGGTAMDMSQYHKIFGTTRLPIPKRDKLTFHPDSKYCVVAYKNYFYKVNLYEGKKIVGPEEILWMLKSILEQTQGLSGVPVGLLTSENRDNWAQAYERLRKDPVNEKSLKELEGALFVLSIDKPNRAFAWPMKSSVSKDIEDSEWSERQTVAAMQMVHGNHTNSGNRWFDKTISFVVGTDGEVGLTYEHSPAEGPPIANMMDFIVNYMAANPNPLKASGKSTPTLLDFNLKDKKVKKSIADAKENLDSLINDLDMSAFTFKKYGRDFIKSCKLSPDSYIQMAIQASFYRLHGRPAAQYESASVRMFSEGRTECIRSCSVESVDFAKALVDSSMSLQDKFKCMKRAIEAHKNYAEDAVRGLGVDRHLLGLKKIAEENKIDTPALWKDEGFVESANFRLSTSQVPSMFEAFMCYGPLVPDGYGCCYNPIKNGIVFGISAFNEDKETNAPKFKKALQETLLEMEKIGAMSTMQSKL